MTLDQLRIFLAVADRQHLTEGARSLHLTPSAATAAIHALEERYGAKLFNRVGRGLELSQNGHAFVPEARRVLQAVEDARLALQEMSGLTRGTLSVAASQTLANYWLPPLLMKFASTHPGIRLILREGNTATVAEGVRAGEVELGCIEGELNLPSLEVVPLADDRMVVVAAHQHPLAGRRGVQASDLQASQWVMREPGSGTRAALEAAIRAEGIDPDHLTVRLSLPTNEAVCAAVVGSPCLTAVSELAARAYLASGQLRRIDYPLKPRQFALVVHKERFRSKASLAFEALLLQAASDMRASQNALEYVI